jgi:cephalosporin hydroxylase
VADPESGGPIEDNRFRVFAVSGWPVRSSGCSKPAYIPQTGVAFGGSILYFASLLDLIGAPASALAVGIDIEITEKAKSLSHGRIRLLEGSSVDPAVVGKARGILPKGVGIVSPDFDHSE